MCRLEPKWVCAPGRLGFRKPELEKKSGLDRVGAVGKGPMLHDCLRMTKVRRATRASGAQQGHTVVSWWVISTLSPTQETDWSGALEEELVTAKLGRGACG